MAGISRRQFLKATVTMAGGLYVPFKSNWSAKVNICPACGAFILDYHLLIQQGRAGYYCPCCGVEQHSHRFKLDNTLGSPIRTKYIKDFRKLKIAWEFAQVPFPNPKLILHSDKPAITLAEIQF